ncbi:MAG: hypothetical protein N3B12_05705 [Armatimonadetes bacterium]|nr:hypothetical protein [Armatimonadota bacterium]
MAIKAGDRITIVTREVIPEDAKTGLYYSYFGGLTGKVDRVYPDGSVCIDVDLDSLGEEMRRRHLEMQEAERKRWLESLSDEVRNRLTNEQKELKMSYRILVSKEDVQVIKGDKAAAERKSDATKLSDTSTRQDRKKAESASAPVTTQAEPKPKRTPKEPEPHRLSEADLDAKEEEFLRSRKQS